MCQSVTCLPVTMPPKSFLDRNFGLGSTLFGKVPLHVQSLSRWGLDSMSRRTIQNRENVRSMLRDIKFRFIQMVFNESRLHP